MSRAIRIELTIKNVLLLLLCALLFGGLVVLASRHFAPSSEAHEEGSHEGEHADHGHGEEKEGAKGHGDHEEGEAEHAEGRIKLTPEAIKNAGLEVSSVGPGDVSVTLALPGEVSLNQETVAHVTPRVAGTARDVKRQVGELVKKGELLATLESRDLAEAQREFLASKERLALEETNFARAEQLKQENISAEKDYLAARQSLAEARIAHRSAAQKLHAIGGGAGSGSGYALVAPLAGTIIEKHISVGEVLSEESRAFTIADLSTIWVNVTVYAKDLPRIRVGQVAEVRAEGIPEPAVGSIAYLGQVVGEQTRSATARVVLKDPGGAWRPGLFATAEVVIDRATVPIIVPDAAVQSVEGKDVVFVQEGEVFEARPVALGRKGRAKEGSLDKVVEVLEGLKAGERIVVKNSFVLKAELGKSEAGHEH
jgi:cobalt-zinc-cadmium efflux system membrane fusion protein